MAANAATAGAIPKSDIELQLKRMLASPIFQRASRPSKFLEFVVGEHLHGNRQAPSEADVAAAVFERNDFDPRLDPIVRVEAARLRKRLLEYYENAGRQDPLLIRLSDRGYTVTIEPAAATEPASEASGTCEKAPPRGVVQMAILPFANLSNDPSLDSFCLGLTEEVISAVTDLSGVCVVARTSATKYTGESMDVREIGKQLDVSHLVEGSVRVGETLYRANVNLVDCSGGFTTWSKQCEIESDGDVLMLQASLGSTIAEALEERLQAYLAEGATQAPTDEAGP